MTGKRVATAVVLIPLVVLLVLRGSSIGVAVALAVVTILALVEYFSLGDAIGHRAYRVWTCICAVLLIYAQWLTSIQRTSELLSSGGIHRDLARLLGGVPSAGDVFFLFTVGVAFLTLRARRPLVEALPSAGISSSALLLVALPLSFAVRLRDLPTDGPRLLLFALVIIWAGDTVAYFAGRAIGSHQLAPRLSPKKTWEGSVAGLAASLLVGWAFHRWIDAPIFHLLAVAAVGGIAGQAGDLLESAYKRSAGVKDSGGLLPGHGGVLDRIDALILAIPVVWYYWTWIYLPRS
jgi:phosphatidate cytidylyltransferase